MNKTAFILFTRSASEEAQIKFANWGNAAQNERIAEGLIAKSADLLTRNELPYFVFSSDKQVGFTFGERLSNAFQEVYDQGFEKVIAIGNDCPQLNLQTLKYAVKQIENNELVLGPTMDGGVYLLGLSKQIFEQKAFQNFSWKTENLFSELQEWADQTGFTSTCLKKQRDLNHLKDLRYFINLLPKWSSLYFLFEQLLNNVFFVLQRKTISPFTGYSSLLSLRAPPF